MLYALVDPEGQINRIMSDQRIDPTVQTKAGWRWLPVVEQPPPAYDAATQVLEGPVSVVGETEVTSSYSVRNLTAEELDARSEAKLPDATNVIFKVLFNHENRIRTLESKPLVTAAQFRAVLKAML
jgi:hypothetical protein